MSRLSDSFMRLTLGHPRNYIRMTLWRMLDSIISALPTGIMILAVWFLLEPISQPGTPLNTTALWICLGALMVQLIVSYFTSRQIYINSCSGTADIVMQAQLEMGEKLRRLPMGFYNRHDAGDLTSVLLRDYHAVENYGGEILAQVGSILTRTLLAFGMFVVIDWRMALALIAVIPLALPFLYLGFRLLDRVSDEMNEANQECDSKSIEYAGGIRTLKAFGLAGEQFEGLRKSFDALRRISIKREAASRPVAVFGRLILSCGLGVVMLVGTTLLAGGTLSPFLFFAFLLIALNLYEPVITLFYFLSDFAHADKAALRIQSLLQEPELPEPAEADERLPRSYGFELQGVEFAYDDDPVLRGISLDTPPRGMTALVGYSGSGKSTIVRLMSRFWDPTAGEVQMGGVPLTQMRTDTALEQVSMVFQDVYLFQDTIANNIRMGKEGATDAEVIDAAQRAACHDFITKLPQGYDTVVGEGGCTLSGGEKQRISIARALLKDAPIVLLDEATASLDPQNEVLVQQAIAEVVRDKTVVVIAHRLRSIRHADRIIVMREGQVVEQGTHDQLLERQGLYAGMWNDQLHAGEWRIGT